jgi:hypothetical protein
VDDLAEFERDLTDNLLTAGTATKITHKDEMTFYLLKWVFNAIKKFDVLENKGYINKNELVE